MLKRLALLVPMSFVLLLVACASHSSESQVAKEPTVAKSSIDIGRDAIAWQDVEDEGADNLSAGTPVLASSILEHASELVDTPHRLGGMVTRGSDCSGFVGYLPHEEVGVKLSRSTRELIDMSVPLVSKDELQSGDLLFFNNRGHGRVSHAGIYIGDGQFIHSAGCRGGGVWVDSLDSSCWSLSYTEAKRVLEPGYKDALTSKR